MADAGKKKKGNTSGNPGKTASLPAKPLSRRAVVFFGAMAAIGTGGLIGLIGRRIYSFICGPQLSATEQAAVLAQNASALDNAEQLNKLKLERINSARLPVAKLSELHHDQGKIVTDYFLQPALILKTAPGQCIARSAVCTHLGCTIQPDLIDGKIFCPCHASYFDVATGNPLSGPATLALSEEPIVLVGNTIYMLRPTAPIKIGPTHTAMEPV